MRWVCAGCGRGRTREPDAEVRPMRDGLVTVEFKFCSYHCLSKLWPERIKREGPQPPPTKPFYTKLAAPADDPGASPGSQETAAPRPRE